jgi:predicted DNA-binding transcriptional regulator AlpA
MMEYEFTLNFKLAPDGAKADEVVERLGKAGCDDALVGMGQVGRIALNFIRNADSAEMAIISALRDVKRALPEAKLQEVSPDFVGLTDVAELVGVTRQNMRKLMLTHTESFPAAVHEGTAALWHLAPVLEWLEERNGYRIEQSLLEVAHFAMQINLTKEVSRLSHPVRREVRALIA